MTYELILTVPEGTTLKQMLTDASFKFNTKFLYTYTFVSLSLAEENPIPSDKIPLKLTLHNHTENQTLQRTLQLFFSNREALSSFIKALPKNAGLDFSTYQYEHSDGNDYYVARIISNILSPTSFEQLKSTLITYFNLESKSTTEMLALAGPLSPSVLQARQILLNDIGTTFTHAIRKNIALIFHNILRITLTYDKAENLGQNTITFALGKHCLSHNLHGYAKRVFEKIKNSTNNKEYTLAQMELMKLYRLSDDRDDLKRCFMAALSCEDVSQMTLCANLLCGFNSPHQFFIHYDFQNIFTPYDLEKKPSQETHVLFKMFAKINKQQQDIKELNAILQVKLSDTVQNPVQLLRSTFNSTTQVNEQNFLHAIETRNPSDVAHYANVLCGFCDNNELFTGEDFDYITQGSDNEDEQQDQDVTTDVILTMFDKINIQEKEIKRLEAIIATKKILPDLHTDTTVPAVIYIFSESLDLEKKNKRTLPPPAPQPISPSKQKLSHHRTITRKEGET